MEEAGQSKEPAEWALGRHSSLARWLAGSRSREVIGTGGRMSSEPALDKGALSTNLMKAEKELI